jgi:hypothetical protein
MSKNSAHQKKVEHAVRKILKAPGLSIPDAMVLANFSKKDVANETLRRAVHRAVKLRQNRALLGLCAPPPTDGIVIIEDPSPSLLDLSSLTGESSAPLAPQFPKPKLKQIRLTSSSVQQRRIDDLKAKRHKSDAHKAAVRLYDVEKQKPNGMSVRKVLSVILAKFKVCPSRSTIARYTKHGLMNASPMKMKDGSRWLIVDHGIQVSMPGLLEPYPNQSDERVRRGQFKEGEDPDARENVQHWNT